MKYNKFALLTVLVLISLVLFACGTATTEPAPSDAEAPAEEAAEAPAERPAKNR